MKTVYEMRISDWSSYVCSSDLSEHRPQVQAQMWISGRKWCDFLSYSPGLPPFLIRENADLTYHAEMEKGVADFIEEMNELMDRLNKDRKSTRLNSSH